MGIPKTPLAVRLIVGVLAASEELCVQARQKLRERFGEVDLEMKPIPFDHTNYYEDELGKTPLRSFLSFEKKIEREAIAGIKLETNEMEKIWNRQVNLDPGYMTLGQFFLATTKDQRHRVYLGQGIFAEVTLYFENGHFHPFDWTYPDYKSKTYINFLEKARERLAYQIATGHPYRLRAKIC
ncbi:MAG: DUF4416 family protein [Fibromonadaceae bacterium]|jgi:hypothetical protein|nr:DUF4416 family protein [Fibromonadaceae bacterium]